MLRIAQLPDGPTVKPWCRGLLVLVVAALTLTLVACPSTTEHSVLEVDATGAGTVRIDGVERSLPYAHQTIRGRIVQLEAVPAEGHIFVRWEGDLDGTTTPTSIVIDRDRSVRALFVSAEAEPDPSEPTPPADDPDPGAEPDPDPGPEPDPEPEPPANDDFADRTPIGGASGSVTGSNVGATMQPDEPAHAGASGGSSVWWSWTAPAPVTVTFGVGASDIDAVVAVYEGEALADLRAPAGVLETDADGTWVTLTAVAGNPYHVAVDGRAGATGSVTLSWSSVPAAGSALWTVEPQTLSFVALVDGSAPEPRIVSLRNDGDAEASFELDASPAWLHAAPSSGILMSGASTDLTVSASACTDVVVESGEIVVSGDGHEATVAVTRDCREPGVPPPVGLSIDRVYVNQAVPAHDSDRAPDARIALVANRAGLLRVFATADDVGANAAQVRFHHHHGAGPERVTHLDGPESVPVSTSEGSLSTSYDVLLPAHVLQPGLQGYLTLHASVAGETVEARFPASGTMTFDVRSVAPLDMTLVPVSYRGTTPSLGDGLAYLTDTARMFPLAEDTIDAHVRATPWPFDGDLATDSGWIELLHDITKLYLSDPEARHHYGVVNPGYTAGIAGIASVGHPIAVGWSHLPSGAYVAAHELGHTWGLWHAPCNVAAGVDPAFPYPDGSIGVWGYDLVDGTLRSPSDHKDLMSYCRPAWVSDYHYRKVMDFREAHTATVGAAAVSADATVGADAADATGTADSVRQVLVVRGWVDAETFHLDPLLMTALRPQPVTPGPYTFIAWDAAGVEILRLPFGTNEVSIEGVRAFHLTLPLTGEGEQRLSRVRVERNGQIVLERDLPVRPLAITPTRLTRLTDGRVSITWDTRAYAALVVRDGPDGALLGRGRSGELTVQPGSDVLELLYSDGLNTERDVVQY